MKPMSDRTFHIIFNLLCIVLAVFVIIMTILSIREVTP